MPRWRAWLIKTWLGIPVSKIGVHVKFRGLSHCYFGSNFRVGDFCWIEAVTRYNSQRYTPTLTIGDDVYFGDLTHISCLSAISIGKGCLFGSKIYIGDHSHGPTRHMTLVELSQAPALRDLAHASPIYIGAACWLGDGVVVLGGAHIAAGSIVAANSVVRLQCNRAALLAGSPARVIRYLDSTA